MEGSREPFPSELRTRRRTLMERRGIRPSKLAEEWGCGRSFVSDLINGNTRSYEKELDLAERLGVGHDYIFPPSSAVPPKTEVAIP